MCIVVIALTIVLERRANRNQREHISAMDLRWRNYPGDPDRTIANSPLTNISYVRVRFNIPAAAIL